ncbi:hypothetical protein UlMin_030591 [Ulmus minor]
MAKCLANRLTKSLDSVISDSHSTFVGGRLIHDNVLVAFEGIHSMRKGRFGNGNKAALKLDMSKAFDRVEWNFIEEVMLQLGYDKRWVEKIMKCVSSVSFSFLLNGEVCGSIVPSRGISQGDPLSPFLFLFCSEGLTSLLVKAETDGRLKDLNFESNGISVSHLLFADDNFLFFDANRSNVEVLSGILRLYCAASGQIVNFDKSEICFGRDVLPPVQQDLASFLGVKWVACGLGFRDLEGFNRALLAKQGWRLIRSPDSLVGKVLKACYYPNCLFLDANLGSSPSFSWRNIWWGRDIIELGSRWRDSDFIRNLFGAEVAHNILSIPVGSLDHEDVFIWHHTRDGEYSVKSGYKSALTLMDNAECSKPHAVKNWWNCFRCGFGRETIFHALWRCPAAKKYWKASCFHRLIVQEDERDILGCLMRIHGLLPKKDFCLFLTLIWQIWNSRNKALHMENCLPPDILLNCANGLVDDYWKCGDVTTHPARPFKIKTIAENV